MPDFSGSSLNHAGNDSKRLEIKILLKKIEDLPTLPAIALQILDGIAEEIEQKKICRLIENDPALVASILKYANSAQFGFRREIKTLEHALVVIGEATLFSLVLALKLHDCFPEQDNGRNESQKRLWQHSLASAVAAEMIASRVFPDLRREAFTAALLHDIGKIFICSRFNDEFRRIEQELLSSSRPALAVEHSCLGADHSLIGKWLAEHWRLPGGLTEVIWLHHHAPADLAELKSDSRLINLVKLADDIAHRVFLDPPQSFFSEKETDEYLLLFNLKAEELQAIQQETEKGFTERAALFDWQVNSASINQEARQRAGARLASMAFRLQEQNSALQQTNLFCKTTAEIALRLSRVRSAADLFLVLDEQLRQLEGLERLLLFWIDQENLVIEGLFREKDRSARSLICNITRRAEMLLDPEMERHPDWVRELLLSFPTRTRALGPEPGISSEVCQRSFFIILPLWVQNEYLGEICLGLGNRESTLMPSWESTSFNQIAALASEVINRIKAYSKLNDRCEELSTVIWKNQQIKMQLIQAERLAAVGQLAAGAAHEINNPLAIISGRAQIQLLKEQDAGKRRDLEQIITQIERISSTLNTLLGFSKPAPPRLEAVMVNNILDNICSMISPTCQSLQIELRREMEARIPGIEADPRQLEQVFLNLAINALHSMEGHGGVLTFATSFSPGQRLLEITVTDTGSGIPRENLTRIFDPFFTTKEEGKGTGLGLSTSLSIVRNHCGSIEVDSEPGRGTSFKVILPLEINQLKPGDEQKSTPRFRSVTPPGHGRRILVQEAEPAIQEILQQALIAEGYEVATANDLQEGLALLEDLSFDLLILGLQPGGRDGPSPVAGILQEKPGLPVLALIGPAGDDDISAIMAEGARKCIRKPFLIKSLLREVKDILNPVDPAEATNSSGQN